MISCVILSAGHSERFGSPKALANISGNSVINHILNTLFQSPCDEILVVLGAHAHQIMPSIFIHSSIRVVYNKDYNFGQTSSVQAGWKQVHNSSTGVLFLPVDCPLVMPSTIKTIIDRFKENQPDILVPTYQQQKGHPPIFHQRLKSKALELPIDQGLNSLFNNHPPETIEIKDSGIVKSFNTPQELQDIQLP